MNALRAAIGISGVALLALVVWAALSSHDLHGAFAQQLGVLLTLPWGVASLSDLYLGYVLFVVVVFLTERSWIVALLWSVPILVLGNVWTAFWLAIRLPHLAKLLAQPNWKS